MTRGIPGRGLAVQPLVDIRLGITVVSVILAVAVCVRRLLRVKAFQGDHFPGTEDALNFTFIVAIILTFLFVTHVAFGLFTPYYIYKQRFGKNVVVYL